jgi:hypothetical protein
MRKLLFFVLSAFSFANIKQFRDENRFQNENGAQKAKVNLKITLMNAKLLVQKESIIKLAYTKCSNEIIINKSVLSQQRWKKYLLYGGPRRWREGKCPSYTAFS